MSETLSADEQAYFDTRGAEAPTAQPAQSPETPDLASEPAARETPAPRPEPEKVPLAALIEERNERKRLADEVRQERQAREALAARLAALEKPADKPVEKLPDFDQDPRAHITGSLTQQQRELAELRQWRQQIEQREQEAQQIQALQARVQAEEAEFLQRQPDYHDAARHVLEFRRSQLAALGFGPAQAAQTIRSDLLGIANTAQQQGKSTAEVVFALARASGYTPKQAAEAAEAAEPAQTAQDSRERDETGRYRSAERLRRGAEFASPAAGGSAVETRMTAQRLMEMSHADFDAYATKNPASVRKLMGG